MINILSYPKIRTLADTELYLSKILPGDIDISTNSLFGRIHIVDLVDHYLCFIVLVGFMPFCTGIKHLKKLQQNLLRLK